MSIVGVDPTSQTNNDHSEALFTPGAIYETTVGGFTIRVMYVRVEDANLAAGDAVYPANDPSSEGVVEVTKDVAGGSRIGGKVIGIALATITDGNYGFIQVAGVGQADLTTGGSVAAGSDLIGNTSADGQVKAHTVSATPTQAEVQNASLVFGKALAADASTTLAAKKYIIYPSF